MRADAGEIRLRFRVILVPVQGDERVTERPPNSIDAGIVEFPLRLTPVPAGPVMRNPSGGVPAGLVYREGADGPEWPRDEQAGDRARLAEIETALDVQRHMPQEEADRLSAEADRLRRRATPRDVPRRARG